MFHYDNVLSDLVFHVKYYLVLNNWWVPDVVPGAWDQSRS